MSAGGTVGPLAVEALPGLPEGSAFASPGNGEEQAAAFEALLRFAISSGVGGGRRRGGRAGGRTVAPDYFGFGAGHGEAMALSSASAISISGSLKRAFSCGVSFVIGCPR